jgi:hypothetical protein
MEKIVRFITEGIFGIIFNFSLGGFFAWLMYQFVVFPLYEAQAEGIQVVWSILLLVGSTLIGWIVIPVILRKLFVKE